MAPFGQAQMIFPFQSTPPCGGDYSLALSVPKSSNFNPRPLAGATNPFGRSRNHHHISIHAPLRGRLLPVCTKTAKGSHFNPRPLAGATWTWDEATDEPFISIHAPLRGRRTTTLIYLHVTQFQSTPPCGGDFPTTTRSPSLFNFNPRPLAGATQCPGRRDGAVRNFNPRPLAGATQ